MNYELSRPAHVSPEQWARALRDFETYKRALPSLIQEGHAGRYALIRDNDVVTLCATLDEALQAADERFGSEPVATYKINPMDLQRLALLPCSQESRKETPCPS